MPQIPIWLTMVLNKISIPSLLGYRAIRHADTPSTSLMQWLVILLFFFTANSIFCQVKGDYIWLGGYQKNYTDVGGHDTHLMKFDSGNLSIEYYNSPMGIATYNASICDKEGKLLFYTNGRSVMNGKQKIIKNGSEINDGVWAKRYWPNPYDGFPGHQDVIILPDPKMNGGYYMLHKLPVYNPPGKDSIEIRYSYIKYEESQEESEITIKNEKFYPKVDLLYSYLTAIRHTNQRDWWILQPLLGSNILTFILDENGISLNKNQPSIQFFDKSRSSSSGSAKFSTDGTKYAIYNYYDQLHVYDFDRSTGTLSNHQKIFIIPEKEIDREQYYFSSVEWSPNGRYIYTATRNWLHQIDTQEPDPDKRIVLIDTYNGTLDPFATTFFLMAQGPDCKIYMSPANGSYSLHVINKPNEPGKGCDFVQNGIKLPNSNGGSLPNFPRFRVDEADKCDPTISSLFGDDVYYHRDIHIYPNPSTGIYRVVMPESFVSGTVVVSDIHGQIMVKKSIDQVGVFQEIDITSLAGGVYHIEIYPTDNSTRIFYGKQVVKL